MRKLSTLLFLALLPLTTWAYDFQVDQLCYNILSDTEVEVTYQQEPWSNEGGAYLSLSGSLTIPSTVTYNGTTYTVTSIGNQAFYYCSSLTSVTIPEGVTSIGSYAFEGCSSLTSVTIPEGATSIGYAAFSGCSSLTSVTIPEGVTIIGSYAFYNCSSLTSFTIPEGVTSIGNSAFYGCSSLTSVTIPSSVTSIGDYVFYGCSSLTSVTIPSSVTSIGDYVFYGCSSLTSITIPEGVTSIGSRAFYGTALYNDPSNWVNNVLYIDNCLIQANSELSGTYDIVAGTRVIAYDAFYNCPSLTFVTIPEGVTNIGEQAFSGCSSLISVTIPNSVTSIEKSAFENCSSLTNIQVEFGNLSYASENGVLFNADKTTLIQYPTGKTETTYSIPNTVTSIGYAAFSGCSSLTSVTIPEGVTIIGSYAFYNCSFLTSFTIPEGVTSIGNSVFYGCSSFTSVTIPNTVTSIGWNAFYNCSSLTSVTIGSGVESIDSYAFYECYSLDTITCLGGNPPVVNQNFETINPTTCELYVPQYALIDYNQAPVWSDFVNIRGIDVDYTLSIQMNEGGKIIYNNQEYTANIQLTIEGGTQVTLQILPNESFTLSSIRSNGTEYLSEMDTEGYLTLPIKADVNLEIRFYDGKEQFCLSNPDERVVFFKTPENCKSDVYVYMWKNNGLVGDYELTPSWPGTKATLMDDGNYRFEIPEFWGEPQDDWMIIWNDGVGGLYTDKQTEDLNFTMRGLYAGATFSTTQMINVITQLCDDEPVVSIATISIEGGLNVIYDDEIISDGVSVVVPADGTLTFSAPMDYEIVSVWLDGVLIELSNNQSVTIENITNDVAISIVLDFLLDNEYKVSVYYEGSNAYTWYSVLYGESFNCNVAANPGYQIQSVTVNGEEVYYLLDEDDRLIINDITADKIVIISTSSEDTPSNISSSTPNHLRAWQANGTIFAEVDDNVQAVMVYDVSGRLMNEYRHNGNYQVITLPAPNEVNILKVVGKDGSITAHKLM